MEEAIRHRGTEYAQRTQRLEYHFTICNLCVTSVPLC
jgi:hypothetical protein